MNKIIISFLLTASLVSTSYGDDLEYNPNSDQAPTQHLSKQQLLERLHEDPAFLLNKINQKEILGTEQPKTTENLEMDETMRKKALLKRRQMQSQQILDFYKKRHDEAVARRNAGFDLDPYAEKKQKEKEELEAKEKHRGIDQFGLEDKLATKNKGKFPLEDKTQEQSKTQGLHSYKDQQEDVYAPYVPRRKYIPEYKKEKYPLADDAYKTPDSSDNQIPQPNSR